jgi:hypothetical protein
MPIPPNGPPRDLRRSALVSPRVPRSANTTKRPGRSSRCTTTCKPSLARDPQLRVTGLGPQWDPQATWGAKLRRGEDHGLNGSTLGYVLTTNSFPFASADAVGEHCGSETTR